MAIPTLGEMLVKDGVITREQLDRALALQKSRRDQVNLIGIILIKLGFIDKVTFIKYLELQTEMVTASHREKFVPRIGELLVQNEVITREQLEEAIEIQDRRGSGPLGIILINLKLIDQDLLLKYLLKQMQYALGNDNE